jgi:hypothetical protein
MSIKRTYNTGDIEMQENIPRSIPIDVPHRVRTLQEGETGEDQMESKPKGLTPPSPEARILATPASEDLPEDLGLGGAVPDDNTPPNSNERVERTDDVESEDRHVAFMVPPNARG